MGCRKGEGMTPLNREEPRIVGPLPGPRSAAWLKRDRSRDVAVVHAGLPAGRARARGGDDRRHGRQPLPGLHRGDRGDQRRALASPGRRGDPPAGEPLDPHVGHRFLLCSAGQAGGAAGRAGSGPGREEGLFHQQRRRGDRGRLEARAAAYGPQPRDGVHERVSRANLRGDVAFRLEADAAPRVSRRSSPISTMPATATSKASAL